MAKIPYRCFIFILLLAGSPALANRTGAISGVNGSIASNANTCMICHGSNPGSGSVTIIGAPAAYVPDEIYAITVRIADPVQVGAGFELSVEDVAGTHVGALNIVDALHTKPANGAAGWVTHTAAGVDNAIANWSAMGNAAEYTVEWQAPATDVGPITFFAAGNAINDNNFPTGDIIYLTSFMSELASCDDGIVCTVDDLVDGECVSTPDNSACVDDGVFCNGQEVCAAEVGCTSTGNPCPAGTTCDEATDSCGQCLNASDCNDGIACTVDSCVAGNCVNEPDDALCADDGLFCNGEEFCDAGAGCVSSGSPCAAGQTCDEATETCVGCNVGFPCSDEDPCTVNDTCIDGICEGTTIPDCCASSLECIDDDDCTSDICFKNQCVNEEIIGCADADEDTVPDVIDLCPDTPPGAPVDVVGCACSQLDSDGDGVTDCDDQCSQTTELQEVDEAGCSCSQRDDDDDGIADCDDQCAKTATDQTADATGCACNQRDADADQVDDCNDLCPDTAAGAETDATGCAATQRDTDADGLTDDVDPCPDEGPAQGADASGCVPEEIDDDEGQMNPDADEPTPNGRQSPCGSLGILPTLLIPVCLWFRRRR